jgi:predicted aldo/keto reductase-like oxidoreductase
MLFSKFSIIVKIGKKKKLSKSRQKSFQKTLTIFYFFFKIVNKKVKIVKKKCQKVVKKLSKSCQSCQSCQKNVEKIVISQCPRNLSIPGNNIMYQMCKKNK